MVSVLFADLVGFTTFTEFRDPEETRELLSRFFDASRELIERYGGTVEKFIGDAVMALWGAPVANEDDAERAVRAALDLVGLVADLGQEMGIPKLRARAGVLTGEGAVAVGATGQGMVAGDLVNTASRIQAAARPATVLVGEATKRATEAAIVYEDAGLHELKGKAQTLRLFRPVRVVGGVGGAMRSEGLEAPFVGRNRELRLIKDLFHASAQEGRAHLLSVSGLAGVGKSRLVWEFQKYIDGLAQNVRWHKGRCPAYGEGVTYWALAEMVRTRCDILEAEEAASARVKLRTGIEEVVADPDERRFIEPRLAHLLGLEGRTASDKQDLFSAIRLFYERLAEEMPTILIFEDVHWADPSLLEFIAYLMDWSRSFKLFVITLGRPDARASIGDVRNATSIFLEPLPDRAVSDLLRGLVPGLPADMEGKILERSEGVPLYAVETVRMLLDRGTLLKEGNFYRLAGAVESLEVPETLHSLIAARLDGLSPAERELAQDASVLGRTFAKEGIASLSGLSDGEVERLLSSLVDKEVLSVQQDPRSPERGQYGFLQDLVRTVAYQTLSKRDRRSKHIAAAAYLQEAWEGDEDEIAEVLASHYLEAYALSTDEAEAEEIKHQARGMLARAGERAASLAAAHEAEHYFERAASLADSALERAELTERVAQMTWMQGRAQDAARRFEESIQLFRSLGESRRAAAVQAYLADVEYYAHSNVEGALAMMQDALAALSHEEQNAGTAAISEQVGRLLALLGRQEEAMPHLENALRLAEILQEPRVYANALNSRAILLMLLGRRDEAVTLLRRALEVSLENDIAGVALRTYNNLGELMLSGDRYDEELELQAAALDLARKIGDRVQELSFLVGRLVVPVLRGRWDEALARAALARQAEVTESLAWVVFQLIDLVPVTSTKATWRQRAGSRTKAPWRATASNPRSEPSSTASSPSC